MTSTAMAAVAVAARFSVCTSRGTEFVDVTSDVDDAVRSSGVTSGMACVCTHHTTATLVVDEFQSAVVDKLIALAERLVPQQAVYRHNDARYSDCERGNAQAHLRATLLGRSVIVPIRAARLALDGCQAIILAEFDGPRRREISVRIVGD